MPITWVAVAEAEGEDPVEISTEPDGTLLLTSVTAQFPGSTGLRFRNPDTGGFRGVRCHEGVLHPPSEEDGWGAVQGDAGATLVYYCVRPKASPRYFLDMTLCAVLSYPFLCAPEKSGHVSNYIFDRIVKL